MKIKIKKTDPHAIIPRYATDGSVGMDLYACIPNLPPQILYHGETGLIGTGISIELPKGYAALVIPRSGLSLKTGLRIANSPGLIDSDYRGEIKIICHCVGHEEPIDGHYDRDANKLKAYMPVEICHGDRIAQLVILPIPQVELEEVTELSETNRGSGGFGSTGI